MAETPAGPASGRRRSTTQTAETSPTVSPGRKGVGSSAWRPSAPACGVSMSRARCGTTVRWAPSSVTGTRLGAGVGREEAAPSCTCVPVPITYLSFPVGVSAPSAAMKASWGTSTRPIAFMRFLPSFCLSSSLRLREMSPP